MVVGNTDGTIRFYDFCFKVVAWFEDLKLNKIKSISFSKKQPIVANPNYGKEKDKKGAEPFMCSDFIVADSNAEITQLSSTIFESIDTSKKKGVSILHGIKSSISAIAVHPKKTQIAAAGADG